MPKRKVRSVSLVPPMILLTKLDETLMLNGIIMVLSSSLVGRYIEGRNMGGRTPDRICQ